MAAQPIRVRRPFLEHDSSDALKAREARLALDLLLFSGATGQDIVTVRRQHCRGPSPNDVLGGWGLQHKLTVIWVSLGIRGRRSTWERLQVQNRTMHDHESEFRNAECGRRQSLGSALVRRLSSLVAASDKKAGVQRSRTTTGKTVLSTGHDAALALAAVCLYPWQQSPAEWSRTAGPVPRDPLICGTCDAWPSNGVSNAANTSGMCIDVKRSVVAGLVVPI